MSRNHRVSLDIPGWQAIAWWILSSAVFTFIGYWWPDIESDRRFIWTLYVFAGPGVVCMFINITRSVLHMYEKWCFHGLLSLIVRFQELEASGDRKRAGICAADLMVKLQRLGIPKTKVVNVVSSTERLAELKDSVERWDITGALEVLSEEG